MKIIIVDLETTGLDPTQQEIIEIGAIITDDVDFYIHDEISIKVKPRRIDLASPKALEVNGYSAPEWQNTLSLEEAMQIFTDKAIGHIFMAYNYHFDAGFIEEAYKKTGIKNPFNHYKIDILSMAFTKIPHDKVGSWSLKTVCTYLGIPPEPKIHRALNGARSAYQVYKKIMQ